jgi:hypothetical protein
VNSVNLIPASRQRQQRVFRRRQLWSVIVVVYTAVVVGATTIFLPRTSDDEREVIRELSTLRDRAAGLDERIRKDSDQLARARQQVSGANAVGEQPDWSVLVGMLARERQSNVTLTSLELSTVQVPVRPPAGARSELDLPAPGAKPAAAGGAAPPKPKPAPMRESYTLRVEGLAGDPDEAYHFAARLEQSELFKSVRVIETRPSALGVRKLSSFRLACELTGEAMPKAKASASAEKEPKP